MATTVPAALLGWIPVTLLLFLVLPARRALLISFIAGWLFLPVASLKTSGLPDFDKYVAVSLPAFLGVVIFDPRRLLAFRIRWYDMPMVLWCVCPFITSLTNGLGSYDGLSAVYGHISQWGVPYLLGRMYFQTVSELSELALAIFVGGLIYVPFCLYEIKMSPQLHQLVYGFHQHSFGQTKRFGGWRPMVFMQHGLMLSLWMVAASLMGFSLWLGGSYRRLAGIPTPIFVSILLLVTVACKSGGATVLLLLGLVILYCCRRRSAHIPLLCLTLIPPLYMCGRASDFWSGSRVVNLAAEVNTQRAGSLQFRLDAEKQLLDRAWQRPVFGWGGWNRAHVISEHGKDLATTDGLWILAFGQRGIVGLAALTCALLLPSLVWLRISSATLAQPALAGAKALAVFVPLYMIDNLMNAMVNPLYAIAAGGLLSVGMTLSSQTGALVMPRRNHGFSISRNGARASYASCKL